MKRGPRIELPSTRDDELPLRSLVATSLACLALGLGVAHGLADRKAPHAAASEPAALAPSASAGADEVASIVVAKAEPAPPVEPPAAAIAAPEPDASVNDAATTDAMAADPANASPQPEAAPEPEAPPQPAGETRRLLVKPGVFAYLRCEGVKKRRGKYPCPRDRELEARMRTIIEALPTCREAHAISRGSFDIRLELGAGGAVRELHVKAPNEAADRAVRACAGPALRTERTELQPTRMIVSMRFKAR